MSATTKTTTIEVAMNKRAPSIFRWKRPAWTLLAIACMTNSSRISMADCTNPAQVFTAASILAGGNGATIVSGDFNGDGRPDLATGGYGQLLVRLNGAIGSPVGYTVGTDPFGVTVGDFNGDGILDLATANGHSNNVTVLLGNGAGGIGDGTFQNFVTLTAGANPFAIANGDFNADGVLDLAITNISGANVTAWLGVGNGTFAPPTTTSTGNAPAGLAIADFSGDGRIDIAVLNNGDGTLSVLKGNGDGTFQARVNYNVGASPVEIASADLDADGRPDCVVSNQGSNTVGILMNSAGGTFGAQITYGASTGPRGLAIADFNGDGQKDLAVSTQGNGSVKLFLGLGGSSFGPAATYGATAGAAGAVAADLSGDGAIDLAVVSLDANNLAIMNGLCGASMPTVSSFSPVAGAVGDLVTLQGLQFSGATGVRFNGTTASFTVLSSTTIRTTVPSGATTGPISVTTPLGTGSSTSNFFVGERPAIDSASPDSGTVGDPITLHGQHFLGATHVRFGGTGEASFTVVSDVEISAVIDSSASTGTIRVTNPVATGASTFVFRIIPPFLAARISFVHDVRGDQGGFVTVAWAASQLDNPYVHRIASYRVWRRATGIGMTDGIMSASSSTWRSSASLGLSLPGYWEALATLPSAFLEGYAYTSRTTQDSTADGNPYTAFFVQALTADPVVFYNSPVDSGYSVDNLAPAQPGPFAAVYGPSSVALHWGASREGDLREYRLYRGPGPDFVPSEANLVLAGADTGYVDHTAPLTYTYKLSAMDRHGNESRFAMVTPNGPTSTLASVVSVATDQGHVRIVWYTSGNAGVPVTIYRRPLGLIWESMAIASSDGTGRILFDDDDVVTGNTYEYRLGIFDGDAEVFAGEVTVTVTVSAPQVALALQGVRPNPALRDRVRVALSLPDGRAGTLALIDVSGRRVREREIGSLGAGNHVVDLGGERLAPGVYLLELRQGDRRVTAKAAVR